MLSFLGLNGHYGESFLFNGGAATMDSYSGVAARANSTMPSSSFLKSI